MNSSSKGSIKHGGSKARLRLTTALTGAVATMVLLAPNAALAADCGPPVAGVITCASTGNPFSGGIAYSLPSTGAVQDLALALDPGVAIDTSGTTNNGITLVNGTGGRISVSGTASTIRTNGDRADGVVALSTALDATGDIDIYVGDIETGGYRSDGIYASTNQGGNDGHITVSAGNIAVSGADSIGINVSAYSGDVDVSVGSVKASGDGGLGILATSGYGNVSVDAGSVQTSGASGRGISAYSAGTTTVTAGGITTSGQGAPFYADSDGVMAVGTKVAVDITGTVSTSGDYSVGVYAHTNHVQSDSSIGNPDIDVTVGSVDTAGFGSDGIHAVNTAANGATRVTVGTVSTLGDFAWGTYAASFQGNVAVTTGQVTTGGNYGTGIIALANGFVTVQSEGVATTGDYSEGIRTISGAGSSRSGTRIDVGTVSTKGGNSAGIDAKSYYPGSTIQINAASVSTAGNSSAGISAVGAGSITIVTDTVSTSGNDSAGIYALLEPAFAGQSQGNVGVLADRVTTSGDHSTGIVAIADLPLASVTVDATHVSTSGAGSGGIYAAGASGTIQVKASDVRTEGQYANGIVAISQYGNVSVAADDVDASGQSAIGIYAASNSGKVTVAAGDIRATGNYSTALAAFGSSVDISTSGEIAAGYGGNGIIAGSRDGGIVVRNDATVTTTYGGIDLIAKGLRSDITLTGTGGVVKSSETSHAGLGILNVTGGNIRISQGDVTTTGSFSSGVVATIGNNPKGADRANDTAHLFAELQNVTTDGYAAAGVQLANDTVTGVAGTGDATAVVHGTVATGGMASVGVSVYSANDLAAAQTNVVSTAGDFSDAIHVDGRAVALKAAGAIDTHGSNALGIGAYAGNGGIELEAGPISTGGVASVGIRAASPGDITVSGTGPIVTTGAGSAGIQATEAARHRELSYYLPYGFGPGPRVHEAPVTGKTISVAADEVATSGADSDGVFVSGSTGAAKVTTGTVAVSGAGSVGVFAEDKSVWADTGTTTSAQSTAIELRGFDSASLNVRGAAASAAGDAVELQGSEVTLTVAAGGSIDGATNGVVIDATPHVTPVVDYWGQLPRYYYAPEQPLPPASPGPGKVVVTNAGTIAAGSGYAILVTGGSAQVTNDGVLEGRVQFAGGDDAIVNAGTFDAAGDSDFGGGNDLLRNSGAIRILAGASLPGNVSLLGLDRFENSGLVDLRNGHGGDTLNLAGDFAASSGSTLGLDVTFGPGASADQLIVGGAATGVTAIALGVTDPADATLGGSAVILVKAGAGSAASAFTLANPDIGFIHYGIAFDAATGSFGLTGDAGAPVYRALKTIGGAANIWNRGTDAWEGHFAERRDGRASGHRLWGQVYAASDTRNDMRDVALPDGGTARYDLGYRQTYSGVQMGIDLAKGGGAAFGVTGSYTGSDQDSRGSSDRIHHESVSLGGYVALQSGPLFAGALAQYGHDAIRVDNPQLGWSDRAGGQLYGAELQLGARLGSDKLYAEPVASLSYLHSHISQLHALGQTIAFDSANGLRGKIGARFGTSLDLGGGNRAIIHAAADAVHEFGGEDGGTFLSGGVSERLRDERIGTYGQGSIGIDLNPASRLRGFVEASGVTGGGFKGFGGRAGISLKL